VAKKEFHLADTEFVRRVESPSEDGVYYVGTHGGEIQFQVRRRVSPVVIFVFAGAVDRARRALPQFGGHLLRTAVPATVIGIADPSLGRGPKLSTAWYAGHEGFETQRILPELLGRVAAACGAERVIFLGASAGGFAALYYAWRYPGSVAVVINAQTDIERHYVRLRSAYRAVCWPGLGKEERLSGAIATSVVGCYAGRFDNTVVYLQNASDAMHVRNHFAPFLAAIDEQKHGRLLARLAYWGREGHKPPPTREWFAWLTAAIEAPSASAEDILRTRGEDRAAAAGGEADARDYRLAAALVERAREESGDEMAMGRRER
jgi:pimeloyl-ACP methyl ester carboxylesterase